MNQFNIKLEVKTKLYCAVTPIVLSSKGQVIDPSS